MFMTSKLTHIIRLIRPVNLLITLFTVALIGWMISESFWNDVWIISLAAISAGLIGAGANAGNDVCDVDIDRINKPGRPIPSGTVSVREATIVWLLLTVAGLTASLGLNLVCALIAALTSVMLYVYNRFLKKTVLWGNFTVSLISGLALIYTGAAMNTVEPVIIPALFAFLVHFAREIVKDMEDIDGDRINGAMTFPVRFGLVYSSALVTFLIFLLAVLTIAVPVLGIYSGRFLILVAAGIYPLLMLSIFFLWHRPRKESYYRISIILKISMIIGVLAIIFGR